MKITYVDRGVKTGPIPVPAHRPHCPGCGIRRTILKLTPDNSEFTSRERWMFKGYGYFCTLRCASAYANKQIEKGFTK